MSDDHGHGGGHGDAHGHGGGHGAGHGNGKPINRQVVIFVTIIAIIAVILAGILFLNLPVSLVVAALIVILVGSYFAPHLEVFKEYERAVVFRFGKFYKVAGPGWTLIWPLFETFTLIDMRTTIVDLPRQPVIAKDDIELEVDTAVYIKITDPKKVVLEVKDFKTAIREILRSQIRNAISKMEMEEVLEKTEEITNELQIALKSVAQGWGVQVIKVEVQTITLPPSLVQAMQKRKEALQYKSRIEIEAQARQVTLDILDKTASKLSDKTMAILYVEALKKISEGKSNKIIFPLELTKFAQFLSNHVKKGDGIELSKDNMDQITKTLIETYLAEQVKKTKPDDKK